MRLAVLALSSLSFLAAISEARTARACDPAPNYGAIVLTTDAPTCLSISTRGENDGAYISATNRCSTEAVLSPGEGCSGCGESLTLAAEESGLYLVDASAAAGTWVVAWSAEGTEGTVEVETSFSDNSDACDGFDGDPEEDDDGASSEEEPAATDEGGCAVGPVSTSGGGLVAIGLALTALGAGALRRRSRRG